MEQLAAAVLLPGFDGTTAPDWLLRRVSEGLGGVVLFGRNVVDDAQVTALCAQLRTARPDVVIGIDEEGGDVTRLDTGRGSEVPGNHALGAADDLDLTRAVAASIGSRLAACGISLNLAPSADLVLTLEDPIIGVRSFGSDPAAAGRHVQAFVEGMQTVGVAACAKHFPGHGASTEDSHEQLPVLPRTVEQLREVELVPFRAAIRAGVRSIMTGHLVVREWGSEPVTLNPAAIRVLRTELGYTGTVITDGLDMKAVGGDFAVGAVKALAAGVDALCLGGGEPFDDLGTQHLVDAIVAAVKSGELSEERLAEAAARTLALGAPPARVEGHDPSIGLEAARRAVRGSVSVKGPLLVVDLVVAPSIAVGDDVPWGLGPYLAELVPGTQVIASSSVTAEEVATVADGRTIVVVTRDAHRHEHARQLVTLLTKMGLDIVHVETGVPGPDLGSAARIDTHGGSRVSLRAAAELIQKGTT